MNRTTGALALLAAGISTISASTLGNDWTIHSVAQLSCCNATTTARYYTDTGLTIDNAGPPYGSGSPTAPGAWSAWTLVEDGDNAAYNSTDLGTGVIRAYINGVDGGYLNGFSCRIP